MLYDYKVGSLYSQLAGGMIELHEVQTEQVHTADNKRRYDLKVFAHEAGGADQDKSALKSVMKPHHFLLTKVEEELISGEHLVDLTLDGAEVSLRDENLRNRLKNHLFVKVRGRAVIEDYERMKAIMRDYPEIAKLINRSIETNIRKSSEFAETQSRLNELDNSVSRERDRNQRALLQGQIKSTKQALDNLIQAAKLEPVEQWVIDGFSTWIDVFLPGIVNFRLYPSSDRTDEHVFGHLKKECFLDSDSNSFHFSYGSIPTEPLTLLGVVTSVPKEHGDGFVPIAEFEKEPLSENEALEKAFRSLFRGFDGLEQIIRTCRFPRVLVQPLTIYRSMGSTKD